MAAIGEGCQDNDLIRRVCRERTVRRYADRIRRGSADLTVAAAERRLNPLSAGIDPRVRDLEARSIFGKLFRRAWIGLRRVLSRLGDAGAATHRRDARQAVENARLRASSTPLDARVASRP